MTLGTFEELILLCSREYTSVKRIVARIEAAGRKTSNGAVYTMIMRMADKGMIESIQLSPEPIRGGRRRMEWRATSKGLRIVEETQEIRQTLQGETRAVDADRYETALISILNLYNGTEAGDIARQALEG